MRPYPILAILCLTAGSLSGCASLPTALPTCDIGLAPHAPPSFTIQLLPGYRLEQQQGIDSEVWRIWKPHGPSIDYDGPQMTLLGHEPFKPADTWIPACLWNEHWLETYLAGVLVTPPPPTDVSCRRDKDEETHETTVHFSFPDDASFYATVKSDRQVPDVAAMVLTYSPGSHDRSLFVDAPTLERRISKGWDVRRCGTALMADAIAWQATDVIGVLARSGVDLNQATSNGLPFLFEAINRGQDVAVRALLANGAKPVLDFNGHHLAPTNAARLSLETLKSFVVEHGVDVNMRDDYGRTFLIAAGSPENVTFLLDRGALLDVQDARGDSALMIAVRSTAVETVRLLVDRGAKRDLRNREGQTALAIAEKALDMYQDLVRSLSAVGDPRYENQIAGFQRCLAQAQSVVALLR